MINQSVIPAKAGIHSAEGRAFNNVVDCRVMPDNDKKGRFYSKKVTSYQIQEYNPG